MTENSNQEQIVSSVRWRTGSQPSAIPFRRSVTFPRFTNGISHQDARGCRPNLLQGLKNWRQFQNNWLHESPASYVLPMSWIGSSLARSRAVLIVPVIEFHLSRLPESRRSVRANLNQRERGTNHCGQALSASGIPFAKLGRCDQETI
jgi:hypothetical protein